MPKLFCYILYMINTRTNYIDLARFVGIYAVVLGHFAPFEGVADGIGRELIYMFHVPLFFVISGMLSKPASISRTFYSLMIPYFIYNIISIAKMDFMALFTFDALELNNSPTWFFAALFFIKIISDYINKGILYYIGAFIAVTVICHYLNVGIPRFMGLHAVVYGMPFFLFGKYIKDKMPSLLATGAVVLCVCTVILICVFFCYERFDLYSLEIHNPLIYFASSAMATLLVLIACSRVYVYIPEKFHRFIFMNSRGTMFILGTHYIALGMLSKYVIPGVHLPFLLKALIVLLSSIPYYYIIKYTYDRIPVLYGKKRKQRA